VITIGDYAGREAAVFGLGRTGLSAARALAAGGARVLAWDDDAKNRAAAEAAGVPVSDINARDWRDFAVLVLSPGVPLTHPKPHRVVELAQAVGVPIMGDVELFARAVNALSPAYRPKVIGVTGTNGKSTTSALIAHILTACGKDARLGGNIGRAVLDLPPIHAGAYYVLELSSYQLDLTRSLRCDVAVWLNLSPDHLDRHGDMNGYLSAKKRILMNQGLGRDRRGRPLLRQGLYGTHRGGGAAGGGGLERTGAGAWGMCGRRAALRRAGGTGASGHGPRPGPGAARAA
jgi:UDP-N-acetylmuramoylalanine--D-glutamate ligase